MGPISIPRLEVLSERDATAAVLALGPPGQVVRDATGCRRYVEGGYWLILYYYRAKRGEWQGQYHAEFLRSTDDHRP